MYEQVEKPKENKSRAIANTVTQKKSYAKQGIGFVNNRPEAVAQRKIQSDEMGARGLQQSDKRIWVDKANERFPGSGIENLTHPIQQKQYYNEIVQLMQTDPFDLEAGQSEPAPDVEGCCAKVGKVFKPVGKFLYWAVTAFFKNTLPNPKVIYDNWESGDTNAINDTRATNLAWEADKIAWIKKILLTAAALIPTKGIYDTISALVTGHLEIQYSPTVRFIPSSEFSQENEASTANSAVVAGLLATGASLHLLEMKIRTRISFITPTPSDRNAARRIDAHVHND